MYSNPERLELLHTILIICSNRTVFTTGERICINQERAKLLEQQREIENPESLTAPLFPHKKKLNAKIEFQILKFKNLM